MKQRIKKLDKEAMQQRVNDLHEDGQITVLVIENGKCTAFNLPEHGDTTIVTGKGKGYKVKFNEEHLL